MTPSTLTLSSPPAPLKVRDQIWMFTLSCLFPAWQQLSGIIIIFFLSQLKKKSIQGVFCLKETQLWLQHRQDAITLYYSSARKKYMSLKALVYCNGVFEHGHLHHFQDAHLPSFNTLTFLIISQTPPACPPAPELTSSSEASALSRRLCWMRKVQRSQSSPRRTQWSRLE